jgi:hypothetical protein
MNPDNEAKAERLAAQSALYDATLETDVTERAMDFLARASLLLRITRDDVEATKPVLHSPGGREAARREFDQLTDDERDEIKQTIGQHWSLNVNLAVRRLWHAAEVLGFHADSLDPQLVAMVAATYFSRAPEDVYDELVVAAK